MSSMQPPHERHMRFLAPDTRSVSSGAPELSLETLHRVAQAIASDLDIERIVQVVTDAATELTGAKFGAFFYNAINASGEIYQLYTLSGAPREVFGKSGMPRKTALFQPTFEGGAPIRCGDVRKDPRYGLGCGTPPSGDGGMPRGHLPVVSYLAVPVVSRSGDVHGGLLFGHDEPDVFSETSERIALMIASHAAIAIDNSRLLLRARFEIEERKRAQTTAAWLAAIVTSSEDAIVGESLDGTITSWNRGAERLFGFSAAEMIGKSWQILVPEGQLDEGREMLSNGAAGSHVHLVETVHRHKDGSLIDISLRSSPVYGPEGQVIGISRIARDITERRRAAERQQLMLREMDHRIKNVFALAMGVVSLSSGSATTPQEVSQAIRNRLAALARAHDLTMSSSQHGSGPVGICELLRAVVAPYESADACRLAITGNDVAVSGGVFTSLALLFHEFTTNAVKYGCLSVPEGQLQVKIDADDGSMNFVWSEHGGPPPRPDASEGFGSRLEKAILHNQLGGTVHREWHANGITIRLAIPLVGLESSP
ncbi:PAS domain S-box protein [Rhizobiaceae bacterium BDR2-2]|uniref:Blue-light-activated histidine kinase n=1 Tax=Ectorhizobium quercum TaxID=2965071 RepID=A0AAE3ST26_9HYPH|nr:PAS domain S-box protein [Ectorhizobium quercum]MCX8995497.1 PAS domain S-box protein [Ectorhizobium quercum]